MAEGEATYTLSGLEYINAQDFFERHRKKHGRDRTAIGGRFSVEFAPTGLGTVVIVHCAQCRKKKNITDFASW